MHALTRLNLHVLPADWVEQTRLVKETAYLLREKIFDRVAVVCLWKQGDNLSDISSESLEIIRAPTLLRKNLDQGFLKVSLIRYAFRAIGMIEYCLFAARCARELRPTHVSCHHLTALPASWLAAKACGAKLIYVPHELEIYRAGVSDLVRPLHALVERLFMPSVEAVVVVCDPIAEWYRRAYKLTKVFVVRNVPNRSTIAIHRLENGGFRKIFAIPESATVFIYQGIFGVARGIPDLLQIFSRLDASLHHIVFMGFGADSEVAQIERYVAAHANIHYLPAVPRDMILSYTGTADIGIFIAKNPPLSYQLSQPNKFFEFTHAGIPVLVSDNLTYMTEIIARERIGWSAPFHEAEDAIRRISREDITGFKDRAKAFAEDCVWEADAVAYKDAYA